MLGGAVLGRIDHLAGEQPAPGLGEPGRIGQRLEAVEQRIGQVRLRPVEQDPALSELEPCRELGYTVGVGGEQLRKRFGGRLQAVPGSRTRVVQRVSPFLQAEPRAKASGDDCKRQIAADFGQFRPPGAPRERTSSMTEPVPAAAPEPTETAPEKPAKKEDSFALFLVKLVVAVVLFRTLLFTSFMIPSESMMPRLLVGDYLFAAKWSYGYSGASLPIDWDSGKGRIFGRLPERGDVVIFKHPIDRTDYVKRVIGLPGDTVQMVDGQLVLNGQPVPKQRVADFVLPIRASGGCGRGGVQRTDRSADGGFTCHFPQFRETLP